MLTQRRSTHWMESARCRRYTLAKGEDLTADNALTSDLSAASSEISSSEEDASMDSASIEKNDTPNGKVEAETGMTTRVRFTRRSAASSADDSAPSPSAGGG